MKIRDLIPSSFIRIPLPTPVAEMEIVAITSDSRTASLGSLFICIKGAKVDARNFVTDAIQRGAVAVVTDEPLSSQGNIPVIQVVDIRRAVSAIADAFYNNPSQKLNCYGVTGTSGKTSVAWLLSHALALVGEKTLVGGTLGYSIVDPANVAATPLQEQSNTTTDPISVHRYLAGALQNGAKNAVFEATSQGSVQKRMYDVAWDGLIYTNLSRDHLDLHNSMEEYEAAKLSLFEDDLVRSKKVRKFAVINGDDTAAVRAGKVLLAKSPQVTLYTLATHPNDLPGEICTISNVSASSSGLSFTVNLGETPLNVRSSLVGVHQIYNLAAVMITLLHHGVSADIIEKTIPLLPSVPGRVESVGGIPRHVYIDYAHKPDALEKVLTFLKPLSKGRLITIFGCGGDRDRGKRPIMGEISARISDITIITSDNPRTESPVGIIEEIVRGIDADKRSSVHIEADRKLAIKCALELSTHDDMIVIAGKGHEPYQEIQGIKYPFSDREVTLQLAKELFFE
jgi:UDP-N-acetylmuramoyl-L-alanyl-D-glutamate--2,6-diaminopimelate ligase